MIYFLAISFLFLAAIYRSTPVQHRVDAHRVHAAIPKPLGPLVRARRRYPLAGFVVDEEGNKLDLQKKFVGIIDGDSCASYGLHNGAEFIAEYLDTEGAALLKHNDVVVVDAIARHRDTGNDLETGRRLRIVDFIDQETSTVTFRPDGYDRPRRKRPISDVEALVTFIRSN